jgi:hypothetical protein
MAEQDTAALWVVEMLNDNNTRWEPTVGARLTRADARDECAVWRQRNPDDYFRVRRYVRAAGGAAEGGSK